MRFVSGFLTSAGAVVLLSALAACEEPPVSSIGELSINGGRAVEMTPGTVRLNTTLLDTAGRNVPEALVPTVETTGPFTAGWNAGRPSRILGVTATGPGTGTVSMTLDGRTATISVSAVQLTFKSIVVDDDYGCGIAADDRAWCWGSNFSHQLGFSTPAVCNGSACQYGGVGDQETPQPVTTSSTFTSLAVGGSSCPNGSGFVFGTCGRTCGLTAAGRAECWGNVSSVPAMPPETTFTALTTQPGSGYFASGTRSCGIAASGKAYCFAPAATALMNGMSVRSLSMGRNHSCAVTTDGDAYCWGSNAKGNLGIGSTDATAHAAPERVATTEKFTTINVSDASTCALSTAGGLLCWGAGYLLSDANPPAACPGSTTAGCQTTPRAIDNGTYGAFALGNDLTTALCALDSAGGVLCWKSLSGTPTVVQVPERLATISSGGLSGRHFACGVGATSNFGYCWKSDFVVRAIGR